MFLQEYQLTEYDQLAAQADGTAQRFHALVGELIDHMDVYHAEKRDGVTNRRAVIYYNCIGAFDVPDCRKIPETDIIMETRKGVAVSYALAQIAV